MGFFIGLVLLLIVIAVAFFGGRIAHNENPNSPGSLISILALVLGAFALVFLTACSSIDQVGNGHIGIIKQFGPVVGTTGSGLVTHAPWQTLDQVSVQNEIRTYDLDTTNSAVSADSQAIYMIVQVNYQLERSKAVYLYRQTGGDYIERILDPNVYQLTKEVTAEYKAIEFAKNRELIRKQVEERLQSAVEPQGIRILNVSLKNVHFTTDLTRAIEQTVEAEQQAKREEARVRISTAQAQQAIAQAKGQAEAQKLRQRTLTPLLIQQQAIEKLNPNVQVIICPAKAVCIPNAGALLGK